MRSKVNPPTVQKLAMAPELKDQGAEIATELPAETNGMKLPSTARTDADVQVKTWEAVPAEESSVTPPVKLILPENGIALAVRAEAKAETIAIVFIKFFMVRNIGVVVNLSFAKSVPSLFVHKATGISYL